VVKLKVLVYTFSYKVSTNINEKNHKVYIMINIISTWNNNTDFHRV